MIERPLSPIAPGPVSPGPSTLDLYRVLIVAVSPSAREALRWALECEPDLIVVGEAADGPAALAGSAALRPDVVLLDLVNRGVDRRGADRPQTHRSQTNRRGAERHGAHPPGTNSQLAEVTAITRALKAVADPPLAILLSTAGDARQRTLYLRAGGDGLLEKGAGWPALVLEMRRALQERARATAPITSKSSTANEEGE